MLKIKIIVEVTMCTLIFLYKIVDNYPIIALHNRYAVKGTAEYPPIILRLKYHVIYPVDLVGGGTWIGFNNAGLFMAITDQHTNGPSFSERSRGLLAIDVLGYFSDVDDALKYIINELKKGLYKRGNFIIADFNKAYHVIHDKEITVREIKQSPYIVTNLTLLPNVKLEGVIAEIYKRASERELRALKLSKNIGKTDIINIIRELAKIASDHHRGKSEYSICYHGDGEWIMSSSTIVAVAQEFNNSKILYLRGNACINSYIDYSYLLTNRLEIALKSTKLLHKKIALCLTGSVATIESPKLARELRRHGADVSAYMTKNSVKYGISPYVMEWATGKFPVIKLTGKAEHIYDYDLVIIYPATANTINKIASGIGDNAVTTLCISTQPNKLIISPAMNIKLYNSHILQENMDKLRKLGVTIIEPRFEEGAAKIADITEVLDHSIRALSTSRLKKRKVLILAGPTQYDLDPIRYISNRATGALGYWLAREGFHRGCDIKIVYGPGRVSFPRYIHVINAKTTEDMLDRTLYVLESWQPDIAIFSAAILDFKPQKYIGEKVKSGEEWVIKFVPTPKVIKIVRDKYEKLYLVAFKLEYNVSKEVLIDRALDEMKRVKANIVVANDLNKISGDVHEAYIISEDRKVREFKGTKERLAIEIFDTIEKTY